MIFKYLLPVLLSCSVINSEGNDTVVGYDRDEGEMGYNVSFKKSYLNQGESNFEKGEGKSVKLIESNLSRNIDGKDLVEFDDVVDVWNSYTLARSWSSDVSETLNLSLNCERDISDYVVGVSKGKQWALKMIDSSGKYTWGFFSGNTFWSGLGDQCREMGKEFVKWKKDDIIERKKDVPPFLVGIVVVVVAVNVSYAEVNENYKIKYGLCLPDSCDKIDMRKIFYFVQDQSRNNISRDIKIHSIKTLSKSYSLWDDPLFYTLMIISIVVTVLVCLGTLYDVVLRYKIIRKEKKTKRIDSGIIELKSLNSNGYNKDKITISKLWAVREHNGTLDIMNSNSIPKPLTEALLSFSLLLNISKVFSLDVGADTLAPIHGLRFFSILWVILGHTCLTVDEVSEDRRFRSRAEKDFFFQSVSNASYSVDTFFFMSGCLVSFLYFRTTSKEKMEKMKITKGCHGPFFEFLGMFWYRYIRLTPTYCVALLYQEIMLFWFHDHTILEIGIRDYNNCRKFWWRNVLYISTYFNINEICLPATWYLANDTQFYILGIIILIIARSFFSVAAITTCFVLILSWITTAIITVTINHVPSIEEPFEHFEILYDKPWTRIGPYLIGMITGWYLYKTDCKLRLNKVVVTICWIVSLSTMFSIVHGIYGTMFGPVLSALYVALSHSGWAVSIAWVITACVTGNGGVINKILSWKYLYPFSRLTYCVYLVHVPLMRSMLFQGESALHLSRTLMAILFFGFTTASYAAALILCLLFEAPVVSLLRIVHPMRKWKSTNKH